MINNLLLVFLLATPSFAYAYTDPGSGLLLLQLLGAFFVGLIFHVKRIIAFIKGLIHKK